MQPWYSAEKGNQDERVRLETLREFQSVLNATGSGIIMTATDGLITHINEAALQMLQYTQAELVGKATPLIFHDPAEVLEKPTETGKVPRDAPEPMFRTLLSRALEESPYYTADWTFIRKDKTRFRGNLTIAALQTAENVTTGYLAVIRDMTELETIKSKLAISEARFHLLAENIPGTVYLVNNDAKFSVIFLNDHTEALCGYPREDFYSGKMNFSLILHPDDQKKIPGAIKKRISEKSAYQLEYRLRHRSGDWRWVRDHGVGIFQEGKLVMFEGFVQDITAQKEAQEKLIRIAEENLRFFNNPVNLNAVADADGYLQRISPSWSKVLGWTDSELKSEPVLNFVHPDDLKATRSALKKIGRSTKVHTFETRFLCKDGSYRWLLWGCAADPETKYIYGSAVDISARKQSEEHILDSKSNLEALALQLQEQNRKLDEFAHIISHNLRAPAKNIQALINLLDDSSTVEEYKVIFEKLKNVSKNLSETMNELLDTLRAKSETTPELGEIRFREVLGKVVQSLEGELITAEASVTYDFNDAAVVRFLKPYLESIFQNLLTNAIKYRSAHRKPAIHFKTYLTDDHIELTVTDNGLGIDMERYGDELFGLHKTFHDHQEARGVGLFLVKSQIESLGGSITAESAVEKGTTFTIRFAR